jgi:hypothetical protein
MAVWQVEFYIVPQRALAAAPGRLTRAVLDDTDWWAGTPLPSDYRTRLAGVAAAASSSGHELETWGPEDGNRIDLWSESGRVRRMIARVDVRRLDPKFGAALLLFVRTASAVLVRSDGFVTEPTINAYAGALRSSSAWRYASDPAAFLAAQAKELDEDED